MKKTLSLILALLLALSALPAMAASSSLFSKSVYSGTTDNQVVMALKFDEITSVKSSDTKVIAIDEYWSDSDQQSVELRVSSKKVGTATVTIAYTLDGKALKASGKFTVKKYPGAIKKLTISVNGKSKAVNIKDNRLDCYQALSGKKK